MCTIKEETLGKKVEWVDQKIVRFGQPTLQATNLQIGESSTFVVQKISPWGFVKKIIEEESILLGLYISVTETETT